MHKRNLWLSLLALVMLGVFAWFTLGSEPSNPTRPSLADNTELDKLPKSPAQTVEAPGAAEASGSLTREAVTESRSLAFRVTDESGVGIAGAFVELWHGVGAERSSDKKPLASAFCGTDGRCSIGIANLQDGSLSVRATADGFAHGWLVDPGLESTIELAKECVIDFHCRLENGTPLEGVRIRLSGSQFNEGTDAETGVPIGDRRISVHSSISDSDGLAKAGGLVPQDYLAEIDHPFALLKSRLHDGYGVAVREDQELDLVFTVPIVAACVVPGESTLKWAQNDYRLTMPHPTLSQPKGLIGRLWREASSLGETDGYFCHFATASPWVKNPAMTVHAFLPGRGWIHETVAYVSADVAHVSVVNVGRVLPCGEGTLSVEQLAPDGSKSVVETVEVTAVALDNPPETIDAPFRVEWSAKAKLGHPLSLPSGKYRLRQDRNVHGAQIEGSEVVVTVRDAQPTSITLRELARLVEMRLLALTEEGASLEFFHVILIDAESGRRFTHTSSRALRSMYVPAGRYVAEVHLPGFDVGRMDCDLDDRAPYRSEQTIVLSRSL